ncbi:MAG TPA: menaquinone biosynthesis protein [Thermodesulfobacteriota bacterium]|nr:menaquinone biosynthesis protein [Thermodesulfobacteriota bacterium]
MDLIKLGSVPFLNVKPLVSPLEEGLVEHDFEIIYTPPSILSSTLFERKVDLGLLPVAELIKRGRYSVVPNISISSYGKVDSVILLTKSNLRELKTVAVDARSRSSTALLRVILEVFYKTSPTYIRREPDDGFLIGVDGGMLIGDTGLKLRYFPPKGYRVFDLGEIWTEEIGLPFVYAVYAVNEGVLLGRNLEALGEAKSIGLRTVKKIARAESIRLGLGEEICLRYLTERIRYDLGEREIKGIVAYSGFLSQIEEARAISDLQIYSEGRYTS